MGGFRDLLVWQKGKALAVAIYKLTAQDAFARDGGLRDQMRRAAVSIPGNISEGDERDSNKDAVRFFYIAKGALSELTTQLILAHEVGYISDELGRMPGSLIKARLHPSPPTYNP